MFTSTARGFMGPKGKVDISVGNLSQHDRRPVCGGAMLETANFVTLYVYLSYDTEKNPGVLERRPPKTVPSLEVSSIITLPTWIHKPSD